MAGLADIEDVGAGPRSTMDFGDIGYAPPAEPRTTMHFGDVGVGDLGGDFVGPPKPPPKRDNPFPPMPPGRLPELFDQPSFQALPYENRKAALSAALSAVYDYAAARPGFDQGSAKFGQLAQLAYAKLDEEHTGGEKFKEGAGRLWGGLTGAAKDASVAIYGALQDPKVSYTLGQGFKVGLLREIDAYNQLEDAWISDSHGDLQQSLAGVKQQIDEGKAPITDPKKFASWLQGESSKVLGPQQKWTAFRLGDYGMHDDAAALSMAKQNQLAQPHNAGLVAAYVKTRDPAMWTQLEKNLATTPLAASLGESAKKVMESESGQKLDRVFGKGASEHLMSASDPLVVASYLLPAARGALIGKAALTAGVATKLADRALVAAKSMALGVPEQAALGAASTLSHDPEASAGEVGQGALDMVAAGTAMHGAGYVGGEAVRAWKGRGAPVYNPPEGAPVETPTGPPGDNGPSGPPVLNVPWPPPTPPTTPPGEVPTGRPAAPLPTGDGTATDSLLPPLTRQTETDPQGTVPETPDTLQAQAAMVTAGTKPAMLFPGAKASEVPTELQPVEGDGTALHENEAGTFRYRPDLIEPHALDALVAAGEPGLALGLSEGAKPEGAEHAVTLRDRDGTELATEAVTPETAPAAAAALGRQSLEPQTDTVSVETPGQVLAGRTGGAPPESPAPEPPPPRIEAPKPPETPPLAERVEAIRRVVEVGQRPAETGRARTEMQQIGTVSPELAARIKEATGVDAKDAYHVVDEDFVRKSLKDHGDEAVEAARGQQAVTPADFERLPEVLDTPDAVQRSAGKDGPALVFSKRFNGTILYVATGPNKNGRLRSKTMWKKPAPTRTSPAAAGPSLTPKALRSETPSNAEGMSGEGQVKPAAPEQPAPRIEEGVSEAKKQRTAPSDTTLKEQKKYLLSEIDGALRDAGEDAPAVPADADVAAYHASERYYKPGENAESFEARRAAELGPLYEKYGIGEGTEAEERVPATSRTERLIRTMELEAMRQRPRVTIEVPGDGVFQIVNTKAALAAFKERAAKFPTSLAKANAPKGPAVKSTASLPPVRKPKRIEDAAVAINSMTTDPKGTRPVLAHVYEDGGTLVSTNGRALIEVQAGKGTKEPRWRDAKTGNVIKQPKGEKGEPAKYPDWRQILPKDKYPAFPELDTARLYTVVEQARAAFPKEARAKAVGLFKNPDGSIGVESRNSFEVGEDAAGYEHNMQKGAKMMGEFDPELLSGILRAFRGLGHEKVAMNHTAQGADAISHPVTFTAPGARAVLMPMRGGEDLAPRQRIAVGREIAEALEARKAAKATKPAAGMAVDPAAKAAAIERANQAGMVDFKAILQGLGEGGREAKRFVEELAHIPKFTQFKETVNQWVSTMQQSALKVRDLQKDVEKTVPNALRREAITNYVQAGGDMTKLQAWEANSKGRLAKGYEIAQSLTADEIALAGRVRQFYDEVGRTATKEGVLRGWKADYINKVWKDRLFASKLTRTFAFGKHATHENFFEGEQEGLVPATKDVSKLMGLYLHELHKTIATRRLIKDLTTKAHEEDGRPLAAPLGGVVPKAADGDIGPPGGSNVLVLPSLKGKVRFGADVEGQPNMVEIGDYKRLNHPALAKWRFIDKDADTGKISVILGELGLHPEIAEHMRKALGESEIKRWMREPANSRLGALARKSVRVADHMNSFVKQTMLSLSPFHVVQEGTHALGHKVNPFSNIPRVDPDNPAHIDAMNHGLMLGGDEIAMRQFVEGLGNAPLLERIPGVGGIVKGISDFTFHKYIPGLKLKTYEHILQRNMERFKSDLAAGKVKEADVKYLSARQTNNAYGHLNYKDMGSNPTFQHFLRLAFLAPDFLRARLNFTTDALLRGKAGAEQRVALGTLAIGSYVAARTLNAALNNGDAKWGKEDMFRIHAGNRTYEMRSVPADIHRLLKDVRIFNYGKLSPSFGESGRKFIMGRLSPLLGSTIEMGTGRNYRGEKVQFSQTVGDAVLKAVPMSLRMAPGLRNLTQSTKDNPVSPWEQFAATIGLHISRYSPITDLQVKAGNFADASGHPNVGAYPISPYRNLRFALEDQDWDRARTEIKTLREGTTDKKVAEGFKRSVFHPYTGKNELDDKFVATLKGDDRHLYQLAQRRRLDVWNRFAGIVGAGKLDAVPVPKRREQ